MVVKAPCQCPASDGPRQQSYRIVAVAHAICPDHPSPGCRQCTSVCPPPTPERAGRLERVRVMKRYSSHLSFGRVNSRMRRRRSSQLTAQASGLFRCVSVSACSGSSSPSRVMSVTSSHARCHSSIWFSACHDAAGPGALPSYALWLWSTLWWKPQCPPTADVPCYGGLVSWPP